jgi:hypothetical protein
MTCHFKKHRKLNKKLDIMRKKNPKKGPKKGQKKDEILWLIRNIQWAIYWLEVSCGGVIMEDPGLSGRRMSIGFKCGRVGRLRLPTDIRRLPCHPLTVHLDHPAVYSSGRLSRWPLHPMVSHFALRSPPCHPPPWLPSVVAVHQSRPLGGLRRRPAYGMADTSGRHLSDMIFPKNVQGDNPCKTLMIACNKDLPTHSAFIGVIDPID